MARYLLTLRDSESGNTGACPGKMTERGDRLKPVGYEMGAHELKVKAKPKERPLSDGYIAVLGPFPAA